jgi:hypothetical protein
MFLSFLFYAFLIYLAYKLIFEFIIPVVRTTRQVKKGFREMKSRMEGNGFGGSGTQPQPETKKKDIPGEYIDYEEVKD